MCPTKVFSLVSILVCLIYESQAQNGESCRTPNGERAICVSIYDCPILLKTIKTKNPSQLQFLKQSQCGFERNPMVCCGSDNNYMSNRNQEPPSGGQLTSKNAAIPDRNACGFQETDRVLGGEDADMDEFPWMALLEYQKNNGRKNFACGGTLISDRYVLTAAHCLVGEILSKMGNLISVRLGEWNTDTRQDCVTVQNRKICNDPPLDVRVESAKAHENYNVADNNRYNDIGLVRLSRKVSYTNFIRAICLPQANEASRVGEKLFIAGWGRTLTSSRSAIKQRLQVPIADKSTCAVTFQSAVVQLGNSQICAGGERNKDSCRGDSGGPLMRTTPSDTSQWYIEGIVSFGTKCGTEGWPGVYTKVSSFLPWIYKNVKN